MAARRALLEPPPSQAASWSGRLAVFGLLVAAIAAALARAQVVDTPTALVLLGFAGLFALVALLLAGAAAVVIWRDGRAGLQAALLGAALALALWAYPAYLAAQAFRLPALNDLSTDVADPPEFSRSIRALVLRGGLTPPAPSPLSRQI